MVLWTKERRPNPRDDGWVDEHRHDRDAKLGRNDRDAKLRMQGVKWRMHGGEEEMTEMGRNLRVSRGPGDFRGL